MEDRHRSNDANDANNDINNVNNVNNDVNNDVYNIDYAAIGQRLRKIRKGKGLSVKEAAGLTGMVGGVVSAIELNRRNPGVGTLVDFARVYGVGLDEIVFGKSIPLSTSPSVSSSELENSSSGGNEEDPYFTALRNSMTQMDESEKEFMVRLVLNAHSEFSIVRAKSL